jgi:Cof subfamily protein (haloacid dehalogenase superfamily)
VLACDLDRTLIWEDGVLRPRTLEAIARARAQDVRVIVATGRMYRSVLPYLEQAGLDEPVICYQGAVVADPSTGAFLRHEPIPLELGREAIRALQDDGNHVNCYVNDELYVAEMTPEAQRYAGFQSIPIHSVGNLAEWLTEPPTKLVAIDEPDVLDDVEARMKERFAGRLYISKSLPYFLEFASPEVTKASGLAFVADHLGFAPEQTVAFGDGENDTELLEWAGFGIAVANAHPRVLEAADWVCPSAAQEGVAQVVEALLDSRP